MKKTLFILVGLLLFSMTFAIDYQLGDFYSYEGSGFPSNNFVVGYRNLSNHRVESYVSFKLEARKMDNNAWREVRTVFSGTEQDALAPNAEVKLCLFNMAKLNSYRPYSSFKNGFNGMYYFIVYTVYEKNNGTWVKSSNDVETPAF